MTGLVLNGSALGASALIFGSLGWTAQLSPAAWPQMLRAAHPFGITLASSSHPARSRQTASTRLIGVDGLLHGSLEREPVASPEPVPAPAPADLAAPAPAAEETTSVAAITPSAQPAAAPAAVVAPAPAPPPQAVWSAQLALINQDRASAGLAPLAPSACLDGIAQQQAVAMAAAGQIFHGNGVNQVFGCGLGSTHSGENVAYRTGGISDAGANQQFMNSAPHRANIMGSFRFAGAAWACAAGGVCYIAVEFG